MTWANAAAPRVAARGTKGLIIVVGSRGGLGTSSLSAHIAMAHNSVVADLDSAGPGLDVLLGIESAPGLRWPDVRGARGQIDGEAIVAALPQWSKVPVLSDHRGEIEGRPPAVTLAVVTALLEVSGVVVDVPRHVLHTEVGSQLRRMASAVVLVVGQDVASVASAWRLMQVAAADEADQDEPNASQQLLVVRQQPGAELSAMEVADALGLALVAVLAEDKRLRRQVEFGRGPSPGRPGELANRKTSSRKTSDQEPARDRDPVYPGGRADPATSHLSMSSPHRVQSGHKEPSMRAVLSGRPCGPAGVARALVSVSSRERPVRWRR